MDEQAIRFRLGIFVLAGLILLAVLITLFGGFPNYLKPSASYSIVFENAPGVSRGTPVRRSGVKIGEVGKVTLDNDTGNVEIEIHIDPGYTLRKGDRATLVQGLLGGDTAIAFLPPPKGEPDKTPIEPGSVLQGYTQADSGTVLQRTAEVLPPAKEALGEVNVVFQKLDKMTPLFEETLKEFRDVARSVREAMPEMRKTGDQIRELTKVTQQMVPDLRKTADEIQLTARTWTKVGERTDILLRTNEDKLVKTLDEFELVVRRVSEVLSEENQRNFRDTLRNVKNGSTNLDSIARNTEELLKESRSTLKQFSGTLTKADDLLSEENQKYFRDTLRNVRNGTTNLDSIARNTEELLKESRTVLKQFSGTLTKTDEVLIDVQKVSKPLAERGDSIIRNIDEAADKLNQTLGDLRDVMQAASRSNGSFQKLLSDPSLFDNLNDAACGLNRLVPRVDRILRDVEIFADKIARHPEQLGVGGALRPGTGLKEAPTQFRIFPVHP